jgi:hypothetical protein
MVPGRESPRHLVHFAAVGTKRALSTVAVVRSGHPIMRRLSQITRLLWFKFQSGLTSPLSRFVQPHPSPSCCLNRDCLIQFT